jgi:ankyrin repeat protein
MTILNFKLNNIYYKPTISKLEKDISTLSQEDIIIELGKKHINQIYNDIFNSNFEGITNYTSKNQIFFNLSKQTPLMFACKINNIEAVKLLINEHGRIDIHGKFAIDFTTDEEIKKLLLPFEK